MKKRFFKKRRLGYYTKGGFCSIVMGMVSLLLFAGALAVSVYAKGDGGLLVGKLAMASFIVSLAGFGVGLYSYTEKDQYYTLSAIGTIWNAVIWLLYLCGYLIFI